MILSEDYVTFLIKSVDASKTLSKKNVIESNIHIFSHVFHRYINKLIPEYNFTEDLKSAAVVSMFKRYKKKDWKNLKSNYKPVCILTCIIYEQLVNHFDHFFQNTNMVSERNLAGFSCSY